MTIKVNPEQAQQQFAQLLSQVLQGEEIVIVVEGQQMARLTPCAVTQPATSSSTSNERIPGLDQGRFVVPDDFDDPLPPDLMKVFEGED
ncbi:MAG: type II toxin-antitoxin system prevent-host-death family antitoxin [Symploca sp. SIO2E6]|nr:type II toxin-antitoxin system prevent-host-death family antitoxin [Symploca sp. SIO2E6]